MGACVTLYVLNQDAYDKTLLPAYQAFFGSGDVCPHPQAHRSRAQALLPTNRMIQSLWTSELNYYQEILGRFNAGGGSELKVSVDWGNGLQRPLTEIVRVNLAPVLMRFLCLVRRDNRIVEQAVWKSNSAVSLPALGLAGALFHFQLFLRRRPAGSGQSAPNS